MNLILFSDIAHHIYSYCNSLYLVANIPKLRAALWYTRGQPLAAARTPPPNSVQRGTEQGALNKEAARKKLQTKKGALPGQTRVKQTLHGPVFKEVCVVECTVISVTSKN